MPVSREKERMTKRAKKKKRLGEVFCFSSPATSCRGVEERGKKKKAHARRVLSPNRSKFSKSHRSQLPFSPRETRLPSVAESSVGKFSIVSRERNGSRSREEGSVRRHWSRHQKNAQSSKKALKRTSKGSKKKVSAPEEEKKEQRQKKKSCFHQSRRRLLARSFL